MILYEWGLLVIRACHLPIHCECVLDLASSHCVFCHSRWKVSVLYVIHWNWCLVQDVLKHWDHFVHVYTLPLGNASKWEWSIQSSRCVLKYTYVSPFLLQCVLYQPPLYAVGCPHLLAMEMLTDFPSGKTKTLLYLYPT